MPPLLAIAAKDVRQRWRDHSLVMAGVVAPLLLAFLISLAFGGSGEFGFSASFVVADLDRGPVARAFVEDVLGSPDLAGVIEVREVADSEEAERLVRDGDASAAFVVPTGFSAAATGRGSAVEAILVMRSATSPIGADVAVAVAQGFTSDVANVRAAVRAAIEAGVDPADAARLVDEARALPPAIELGELSTTRSDLPATAYFAPAMGIFFAYYVAGLGARSLVSERKDGTLARLQAAPVPGWQLLTGKVVATFGMGVAALGIMAVASTLLLDARWGAPLPAAFVIVATIFAITGVTALVLTIARTEQQVGLMMAVVTFGFALLGGNFVSLAFAPVWLQQVSRLTPNGQALWAIDELAAEQGDVGDIVSALAFLVLFGVVAFGVAVVRSRRVV